MARLILTFVFYLGSLISCGLAQPTFIPASIQQEGCHNADYVKVMKDKVDFYEEQSDYLYDKIKTCEDTNRQLEESVEMLTKQLEEIENNTGTESLPTGSWGEWSAWSASHGDCDQINVTRDRQCYPLQTKGENLPCKGNSTEEKLTKCSKGSILSVTKRSGMGMTNTIVAFEKVMIDTANRFSYSLYTLDGHSINPSTYLISLNMVVPKNRPLVVKSKISKSNAIRVQTVLDRPSPPFTYKERSAYNELLSRNISGGTDFVSSSYLLNTTGNFLSFRYLIDIWEYVAHDLVENAYLNSLYIFSLTGLFEPLIAFSVSGVPHLSGSLGPLFRYTGHPMDYTVEFNKGDGFNTSVGGFIAPVDGVYIFTFGGKVEKNITVSIYTMGVQCEGGCPNFFSFSELYRYYTVNTCKSGQNGVATGSFSRTTMQKLKAGNSYFISYVPESEPGISQAFSGFLHSPIAINPFAFSAMGVSVAGSKYSDLNPVRFTNISVNEGDAFIDNSSFKCNTSGFYFFQFGAFYDSLYDGYNALEGKDDGGIDLWLLKNAEPLAAIINRYDLMIQMNSHMEDQRPVGRSIILSLSEGDTVHLCAKAGSSRKHLDKMFFLGYVLEPN